MKDEKRIKDFLESFDSSCSSYPGMSYEEGIESALRWVLGEISDEELGFNT